MNVFVLLEAVFEPGFVQQDIRMPTCAAFCVAGGGSGFDGFALKGVLEGDGAAVLLTEEGADDGARLAPEGVSRYIVRYCEEDQRMEGDGEAGVGGWVSWREEGHPEGRRAKRRGEVLMEVGFLSVIVALPEKSNIKLKLQAKGKGSGISSSTRHQVILFHIG